MAYCADGGEVASTITRQISEQSGQDNRANAVVQCYENNTLNHSEVCRTLTGNHDDRVTDTGTSVVQIASGVIVRRLTPTEAERLMGLPDGYTIPRGLKVTDELVAEFQRIHDTFGAIMAEYEHKPAPKPKSANQVRAWLEKITDPDTCPDSPRYKACGNGWATNQPRWILTRLLALGEGIDPFTGEEL